MAGQKLDCAEEEDYDIRTTYPGTSEPILKQVEGLYDSVFVALHPFVSIEGCEVRDPHVGAVCVNRSEIEGDLSLALIQQMQSERSKERTLDYESYQKLAKVSGQKVDWLKVGEGCGLNRQAMNRALLTSTLALKSEYQDQHGAERLAAYCGANNIFFPESGKFPSILENQIVSLFERSGVHDVYISDELDLQCERVPVSALDEKEPWGFSLKEKPDFPLRKIFSTDYSLLVVVDWDSFFTLVCVKSKEVKTLVDELFDGFWCDATTMHRWYANENEIQ